MTNKEKIIYLAGLIDGEAWIGIAIHQPRNKSGNPVYVPNLTIKMTDKKPLDLASSVFGKKVYTHALLPSGLTPYSWRLVNAPSCIPALEALLPFLITKKKVAKILLKYCYRIKGTRPARKLPAKEIAYRHHIYITLKELNALD